VIFARYRWCRISFIMRELSLAISEAARAASIREIGLNALPALARALGACPAFLAEAAADFTRSEAIAGEHRAELPAYLRDFTSEDPLIRAAVTASQPVCILEQHVERNTIRASRAYNEFHRVYDFEHHMLVRFFGDSLLAPGSLAMGFTRGKNLPAFGARELRIAELVLPALHGAARRIATPRLHADPEHDATSAGAEHGLTRAETRVLSVLLLGFSNDEIARRLYVSVDTVKTHLQRIFRKLGVASRAQAVAAVHATVEPRHPRAGSGT
jgi:DNA-binding CsgD family transcriptional regulator